MRTETKEFKIYEYKELSEEAKESARNNLIDILNHCASDDIDEDINQFCNDFWGGTQQTLKDIGLTADNKQILSSEIAGNRGMDHITFDSIWIDDREKFINWLELDKRTWESKQLGHELLIYISGSSGAYSSKKMFTEIELDICDDKLTDEQYNKLYERGEILAQKIENDINDFISNFVKQLTRMIESLWEDENIISMCEANEWEFLENGSRY